MTPQRFRQLVKRFHPDTNHGSNRYKVILLKILQNKPRKRKTCVICGETISHSAGQYCGVHARYYRRDRFRPLELTPA